MTRIAQVNLTYNPRTLWFDAGELDVHPGDSVVVTTARGTEFGHSAGEVFEADDEQIKNLKSPLKPVVRIATEEDEAQAVEMDKRGAEALPVFKELAAESNEDMRPVSVEYLLEGDKAVFYFEAEDRVDFRDLVRKLASRLHVRVDMRQIGVRDKARMVGGLGHCGQELCCKRMCGEFNPVSIRMAKEQDLSLNPQKISGVCGRLMCCLRYEFDTYKDFKSRAPKQNASIDTPDGQAKVISLDVPREEVSLRVEDEKPVKIPLSDFDAPAEGQQRPSSVSSAAWEAANARASFDITGGTDNLLTSQLTGADQLAEPTAQRSGKGAKKASREGSSTASKNSKTNAAASGKTAVHGSDSSTSSGRKPRRRRSTKLNSATPSASADKSGQKQQGQSGKQKRSSNKGSSSKKQGQKSSQKAAHASKSSQNGKTHSAKSSQADNPAKQNQGAQKAQRPGQKSSGLRQQQPASDAAVDGSGHRRSRRRSHKAGRESKDNSNSAS